MKRIFTLLIAATIAISARAAMVSGYVVDAETGEALAAATVVVNGANTGMTTDARGRFEIEMDSGGSLTVTYVGYCPSMVSATDGRQIEVKMSRSAELRDVQVYGARGNFGVQSAQMSAQTLSAAQIRLIPTVMGETDVMKSLQKLPGVQSASDGAAGIYVRGGSYDQNLITLDGSTLYNGEHLRGFTSSIIPDMVDNVTFYKGAFPARYGSRLSSIVDIGLKDGDFNGYHGNANIGMLASGIHAEGPILKGRTSFNVAARASYFNWILQPLLKNVYDNPNALKPYSKMNFYDVNAKLVHRLSSADRLTAVVYWGKDLCDVSPSDSHKSHGGAADYYTYNHTTINNWDNVMASVYWTHMFSDSFSVNVNANASHYAYFLKLSSMKRTRETVSEESYASFDSKINEAAVNADFRLRKTNHDVRWGLKGSYQWMLPAVDTYSYSAAKSIGGSPVASRAAVGNWQHLSTAAVYAEDDWTATPWLKANVGLRYSLYAVPSKTYHSIEPRASIRFLLSPKTALKLSYARMSQAIHMLSTTNIMMPSTLWVPVTEKVPLMRGNQYAASFVYEPVQGIEVTVEGYYKTADNVIQYKNGATYMAFVDKSEIRDPFSSSMEGIPFYEMQNTTDDWQSLVVGGRGRSYGVEVMVQKKLGKTTGWISYTWSKSLRTFDRPGEEINGGKEFFDPTDRRHNFNIVVSHRCNRHWTLSAAWTYQSGRRGNLPLTTVFSGQPVTGISSESTYIDDIMLTRTYSIPNSYKLPDIHRLDVGVTYNTKHRRRGESEVGLTVYNLYNQKNVSYAYAGYDNNVPVLKGVCIFPFMPSINYKFIF